MQAAEMVSTGTWPQRVPQLLYTEKSSIVTVTFWKEGGSRLGPLHTECNL